MVVESPNRPVLTRFDLAAEAIAVRIRWFGVCVGFALVNLLSTELLPGAARRNVPGLNMILGIGVIYVVLDTIWSARRRVFLSSMPLAVSFLEAIFIGLLCDFDTGQDSHFRFYYLMSLVICAMRYSPVIAYTTFLLHSASYSALLLFSPSSQFVPWLVMLVSMGWVTWASTRMTMLARIAGDKLAEVNTQLAAANEQLERGIALRTQELHQSQAMLVQQEKQAAFGLLAAGIAHEVGNPLAAISSLVQLLKRKVADQDTLDRYELIGDQLRRIQGILRELVDFSRPASPQQTHCDVHRAVDDALNIAKYYKRRKGKRILTRYALDLPPVRVVRDQLVQVFLNLVLNAMDATPEGGLLEISTSLKDGWVQISFRDSGHGIRSDHQKQIFEPYFTTKETGTGLGLFVCRQILGRSGEGRIELTQTGPEGTTFTVFVTDEQVRTRADIDCPPAAVDHSLSITDSVLPADV